MAIHYELGKKGEASAVKYLEEKGYFILNKNWHWEKAEIDIIAETPEKIVFVEVKTRSSDYFGSPEEFATHAKEQRIINAADYYIESRSLEKEVRFDVISIIIEGDKTKIEHIEDCYSGMG